MSGQQQANVSQQSSSAETKPVVRRVENSEPIIFDLGERDDEAEDHGIRAVHFYIRDDDDDDDDDHHHGDDDDDDDDDDDHDDDEPCEEGGNLIEENLMDIENEESKVRRLGEKGERERGGRMWPSLLIVELM